VVQLPVKVATFLLNEKREAIRAIEQRHRVGVLLVPNESLETPHFKLNRLRVDELSEDQLRSYALAEDYEEPFEAKASPVARSPDEEPAVKGVAPATPAPTPPAPPAKPQANLGFFGWLWSNLFGQPPRQQTKDERPARMAAAHPAKPDRHRRERPGRRPEAESAGEAPAAKPVAAPVVPEPPVAAMATPVEDARPEPALAAKPPVPVQGVEEIATAAEIEEESPGSRGRRGRRGGRRRRRGEAPALPDTGSANLESGERMEEGAEPVDQGREPMEAGRPTAATPPPPGVGSSATAVSSGQRRIRSGRPRLPREALAAARAAAESPPLSPAQGSAQEAVAPPPPQPVEYPVVEENPAPAGLPTATGLGPVSALAVEAPAAEAMAAALEPVTGDETAAPQVEASELLVESAAARPEALPQSEAAAPETPFVSLPGDAIMEASPVAEQVEAPMVIESRAVTPPVATAEAAELAESMGEAPEPTTLAPTRAPETNGEDKPAV
jgi:ribonuclease E